ncbi:MTP-1 family protein [Paenibacillus sp. FA6]|uniref:MTP-1 family protein n=1 Tax=Paenibacillus sp. FA6 TaxID=3413029 RepID=UPI003F655C65
MNLNKTQVKTCDMLLQQYLLKDAAISGAIKLVFTGVGDKDVYNITSPFEDEGEQVIAGRVESRDSEHSEVIFFVEKDGQWIPRQGAPILQLQDPFHTVIGTEHIIGGVQIFPHPEQEHALMWRTTFYKGDSISSLKPFFTGPDGMKDLRLTELPDGSIGVLTRPQGDKGGRGKIGFFQVKSLGELTVENVENAPLLENQFIDDEWGGANEAHILKNGLIGVLGHIACFDKDGDRHYYPIAFALNPKTGDYSDIELIAVRANFIPGPAKRSDLQDVVFSGGLIRQIDGTAVLYAGIGDAEAHRITIQDPFIQYENNQYT